MGEKYVGISFLVSKNSYRMKKDAAL